MNYKNDGSLAESIIKLTEWRQKRYGLSSPKTLKQKILRSIQIVLKNKLNFLILILGYFIIETIGNAALLVLQWSFDKDSPKTNHLILVQITANWPIKIWRSLLNSFVLYIVLSAIKRKGNILNLTDIFNLKLIFTKKTLFLMFISDIILSSPLSISQALISSDIVWAIIYLIVGFILNWIFGMSQILLFEDFNLPISFYFIWSASVTFSSTYFSSIFFSYLFIFISTPLIITTPLLLVLQIITFFDIFGFSSPDEVHLTSKDI